MIPISLNISDLAEEFSFTREDSKDFIDYVLSEIVGAFAIQWREEAKVLKSTRKEYQRSIQIIDTSPTTKSVVLRGWLPNAVESGLEAFDMKPGFERSSKKKYNKTGGWYLTIPFRWATPEAEGDSSIFSGRMPKEIHKIAKKQPGKPLSLDDLPEQYRPPKKREKIVLKSKVFEEYVHKTSIYHGIVRKDVKGHSQYMSFRRVSEKSMKTDPNSWIHKGITARNLAEKALGNTEIDVIADTAIDNYLANF